jgi:membrane dipeptidase
MGQDMTALLVDAHIDLTYSLMRQGRGRRLSALHSGPVTLAKMRQANLKLFCNSLFCEDRYNGEEAVRHLRRVLHFSVKHLDGVWIVKSHPDFQGLMNAPSRIGTVLLLENADALVRNRPCLEDLVTAGFRIVGLTHVGRNRIADGNKVRHARGFSAAGRDVVRALEARGLMIDVAHLHPECFRELLDLYGGPLCSSHTGLRELCDKPRNIDLEQAGAIVDREGVIGVSVNPEMLSLRGEATIDDVFHHLDLLVQRIGPKGVGIGSDFCGFTQTAAGLEDITGIRRLSEMMLTHGYGDEAVADIMARNWWGLFERLFKGSERAG